MHEIYNNFIIILSKSFPFAGEVGVKVKHINKQEVRLK